MIQKHKCVECGCDFESNQPSAKFCSKQCKLSYHRNINRQKRFTDLLSNGVEGVDYVIDLWNGLPTPRIYGQWMKYMHPNKTIDDYKAEFPDASICCLNDYKNVTLNSGKHMKLEKYRKMFSEKMVGENNPMHHSKRSAQSIRENSPYCDEFYMQ